MNWLEALGSSTFAVGVVVTLAWMTRQWWSQWVANSLRASFDAKIESLRSELRMSEAQIAAVRETALANVRVSQAALVQRRIQAVDDVWEAVNQLAKLHFTLITASLVKIDDFMSEVEREPQLQRFAEEIFKNTPEGWEQFGSKAASAEPYVSQLAWALFNAYRTTYFWAAMVARIMQLKMDARPYFTFDSLNNVLVKALPDMEEYIKKSASASYVHSVIVLRERILAELRDTLAGKAQDAESIARAAEIEAATRKVTETMAKGQAEVAKR